jgi:outer membrane protein OmpA-like peptidoglycan-associated protein
MGVQDDDVQGYALGAVFGILALVLTGVIGLASARVLLKPEAPSPPAVARVYFEAGEDALSWAASDALVQVAAMARESVATTVVITGSHDATGSAMANAVLAVRRAERVRHALEASGVPVAQMVVAKPVLLSGDGDPQASRRVDIRMR